ncbi:MAG: ABC transporter permease subunit [Spirochaetes bacterium]|nr:ABC transporter permease subunit [Spirochaetota bacterium]
MKSLKSFFSNIKNNIFAFLIFIFVWFILSLFFEDYIIPSPFTILQNFNKLLTKEVLININVTIKRTLIGFFISIISGAFIGIFSYLFKINEIVGTTLLIFQVIPGTILGIIFLLIFGISDSAPIALIVVLTTPTIAINTSASLLKRNQPLENLIKTYSDKKYFLIKDSFLPSLIPTFAANIPLGFGLAFKVVILGEFIATQNGLGHLLNVARIYFNMKEVFFYLFIFVLFITSSQIIFNLLFFTFFKKYLNPS